MHDRDYDRDSTCASVAVSIYGMVPAVMTGHAYSPVHLISEVFLAEERHASSRQCAKATNLPPPPFSTPHLRHSRGRQCPGIIGRHLLQMFLASVQPLTMSSLG